MKKVVSFVLMFLVMGLALISLTSCGDSSELCIVHFDQSILGDNQKDLSVSVGIKKSDSELESAINSALSTLTTDKRNELMIAATERSALENPVSVEGEKILYTAPYDSSLKTLTVGLECNYAPFNWTDTTASSYSYPISGTTNLYADGYDIQVAKYLASKMGYNLVIVKLEWDALIPALEVGTINAVIAGMTDTEERRQSISFSDPYYTSELVLVVKANSKYASATSLEDFRSATFVSQISTVTDSIIDTWVISYGVVHQTALKDFATCAMSVRSGSSDCMTAELPVATSIVTGVN